MYEYLIIHVNGEVAFLVHYNTNVVTSDEIKQLIIDAWEEDGIKDFDEFQMDLRDNFDANILRVPEDVDSIILETVTSYKKKDTGEMFVQFGTDERLYSEADNSGSSDLPKPIMEEFTKIGTKLSD